MDARLNYNEINLFHSSESLFTDNLSLPVFPFELLPEREFKADCETPEVEIDVSSIALDELYLSKIILKRYYARKSYKRLFCTIISG